MQDKLYKGTVFFTVIFALLACMLMAGYKVNEEYWNTKAYGFEAKEAAGQEKANAALSQDTKKLPVSIVDKAEGKVSIPFAGELEEGKLRIYEEFTKNKLVLVLTGASLETDTGKALTSDSRFINNVAVYAREDDIIIELCANDTYVYQLENTGESLVVSFDAWRAVYDKAAVIYVPFGSKVLTADAEKEVKELCEKNQIKLFTTSAMQESYTQEEVISFANSIRADMVLGVYDEAEYAAQGVITVYNELYFIPDFGSIELAVIMEDELTKSIGQASAGFKAAGEKELLIKKAAVPAAAVCISDLSGDAGDLSKNIMSGICSTIERVIADCQL